MQSSLLFTIATLAYLAAMVCYISFLSFKKEIIGKTATIVTLGGFVIQTIALFLRWRESYQMDIGRVPLTNLYESLVFFTWSTVLIYLIVEYKYKTRAFGAFVLPVAFLALAFINVAGIETDITPLVPALKSNWLFYHVLISFLGYAAFSVAFSVCIIYMLNDMEDRGSVLHLFIALGLIAGLTTLGYSMAAAGGNMKRVFWYGLGSIFFAWVVYLTVAGARNKRQVYLFWSLCVTLAVGLLIAMGVDFALFRQAASEESFRKHMFESTFLNQSVFVIVVSWAAVAALFTLVWTQGLKLETLIKQYTLSSDMLEEITYKMIAVGWPLLTAGILTGAVWANSAWGTYWSWDPKETWSLITWFVYAIYLHARYVRGWKGTQMAVIACLGFLSVIFTYLGVNLVLSGLHSYGGMN
ncbi:MAG: cytochrome c biogenesis protein CcsA [Nitrospirae bacterium]|nr:cytochrome c biogenesis protein CcsA [Nitrospirota bacterium]